MTTLKVRAHWSGQTNAGVPVNVPASLSAYGTPPSMTTLPPWAGAAPTYHVWAPLGSQADLDSAKWGSTTVPPLPPQWPTASGASPHTFDQGYSASAVDFVVTGLRIYHDKMANTANPDFTFTITSPGGWISTSFTPIAPGWTTVVLPAGGFASGKGIWRIDIDRVIGSSVGAPGLLTGTPAPAGVDEPYVSPYGSPYEGILGLEFTGTEVVCPVITTATAAVGPCDSNGDRQVTYDIAISPPIPVGATATVIVTFGGLDINGVAAKQTTVGGGASSATVTSTFAPGIYSGPTAELILAGSQCPVSLVQVASVKVDSCIQCPDPNNPVTITVSAPNASGWCAPVAGGLAASICAQLNWLSNSPPPPLPDHFDIDVTVPGAMGPVKAHQSVHATGQQVCASTASGWTGPGATATGALDLSQAGTYDIAATAVFGANSGLPTNQSGAITCDLTAASQFMLPACPVTVMPPCPTLGNLSVSAPCADPTKGTVANATATVAVMDPAGIATGFDWDFGDPGSANNTLTTPGPMAAHGYAKPGTYTVKCSVKTNKQCSGGGGTAMANATFTVADCTVSKPHKFGCDVLLWIALVFLAISGILAVIGCILSKVGYVYAAQVLGIIALVCLAIGLTLLILWFLICRFFTACQVIIDALDFMTVMVGLFGILSAILALIAKFSDPKYWDCFFAAIVNFAGWAILMAILYQVATKGLGCLIPNPFGSSRPPPASGSSSARDDPSAQSSAATADSNRQARTVGEGVGAGPMPDAVAPNYRQASEDRLPALGDAIARMASAIGLQPCPACHRRAERLNEWSRGLRR